jgi:phenylacetyl-CoA:acceptor oxidoreductase subunit 2
VRNEALGASEGANMRNQAMSEAETSEGRLVLNGNRQWQAVGSFVFGGSGAGLMLFCAVSGAAGQQIFWLPLAAVVLTALALLFVMLHTGQILAGTLSGLNEADSRWVIWEPRAAVLMVPTGVAVWWMPIVPTFIAAGLVAAGYLLCQSKSLEVFKNVPAWKSREVVPLMTGTGAVEGVAGFVALTLLAGSAQVPGLLALLLLLAVRWMNWRRYLKMQADSLSPASLKVLQRANPEILWAGHMLPVAVLVLYALYPAASGALAIMAAAIIAIIGGWYMKFIIIARASFTAAADETSADGDGTTANKHNLASADNDQNSA